MIAKTLSAALIGTVLFIVPTFAENTNAKAPATQPSSANQKEQNASASGMWQASKLIGLNVYNNSNEKIGDIKQLMVDKQGNIELVVIGVGGFLGIGERDVAVKFSELKWSDQPAPGTTSSSKNGTSGSATTGAASNNGGNKNQTYPDHAVLNASKDQLNSMSQFNYNK